MSYEFVDRMMERCSSGSRSSRYGEIYAGEALDPKTRALCTVAMLTSTGQQLLLGVYAGFPVAWDALATMKAALEDFEEAAP